MNLTVSFKHMDPSDSLKEFIREKSSTLTKYFQGNVSVTWILSIEKQNRIAHCHLVGNNLDIFGESTTDDFKASIDFALDKVEKQIRKQKEMIKDHLHKQGNRVPETSE